MRKNKSFKSIWTIVLFVVLLSLSGCWSAKKINDLAIINIIGIDQNDAGDIEVSTLLVKPASLFAQTTVGGKEESFQDKFLIETTTGKNIFEAMGKLSNAISENIYLGHVNVVIFGEDAARDRMESSLDFFRRENNFRPNIKLLVTKGRASDMIKISPEFNLTLGLEIQNMTEKHHYTPTMMVKDLSQFLKDLTSNTIDPITGVVMPAKELGVEAVGENKDTQNKGSTEKTMTETESPRALSTQGTAVFKGGHLKGFLDEDETRGLLSIQGELQNEIVVLSCGEKDNGTISVIIRDTQSQFSPHTTDENMKMLVNIEINADITEITCSNLELDTEKIERLNKQLGDIIVQDASNVLNKAQKQWQTDIFGFGQAIYRKNPREWDQMAPEWRNGTLKKMNVDLKVQANISRYGLLKNPSKANESR